MSGMGNLPIPFQIPMPLIPKKSNNKLRNKSQKQRQGRPLNSVKNKHGTGKKSGANKDGDVTTTTKLETRSIDDDGDGDVNFNSFVPLENEEVVQRMRRHASDEVFSDEERKLRDEWLSFDTQHDNIPSAEVASFMPSDLSFIYEAQNSLKNAYDTIIPRVKERLQKRSPADEDEDVEEKHSTVTQKRQRDEEDLVSFNKVLGDEDVTRIERKRDLTDYDFTTEEDADDLYTSDDASDIPRNMKVREISPADDADDDTYEGAIEIVDDREEADYADPIIHHVNTRETLPQDGRSVRFE